MHLKLRHLVAISCLLFLSACASIDTPPHQCPPDTQKLPNCPPHEAIDNPALGEWHDNRTWMPASERDQDLLQMGIDADIPVQWARGKVLGTSHQDALYSLAAKIHMIEQAEHSVDAVYYIYKDDVVGRGLLGAMCAAVKRGVDVRLMVDSLGTISLDKNLLRALYSCQWEAGFVRAQDGQLSTRRARVQVIIFNPLSNLATSPNRRSHDKLMVVDGFVPDKALVITGGRNISLDYYGVHADGSRNDDTYLDAELLLRPMPNDEQELTVSEAAEIYFSLLAGFHGNRHIQTRESLGGAAGYAKTRAGLLQSLEELKSLPDIAEALEAMPEYLASGYADSEVLLAHEFDNLINSRVVRNVLENKPQNPNSITMLMAEVDTDDQQHLIIVSPYLFAASYRREDGTLIIDQAEEIWKWIDGDPNRQVDILTNSVLTSDNFFAQAFVDMDMAPRVLLDQEARDTWRDSSKVSELNPEFVESEAWNKLISNPRVRVWETGRLDDVLLGGTTSYGKLHAKYVLSDQFGFLGTTNFDYRSRLFNNEMGFFFRSPELYDILLADFESLKARSYRWGSPEWLEMRARLVEEGGMKGFTTSNQRFLYKLLKNTGLYWLF